MIIIQEQDWALVQLVKRWKALHEGYTLICSHEIFGDWEVYMNPQRNNLRIGLLKETGSSNEWQKDMTGYITAALYNGYGKWYIKGEVNPCPVCAGTGKAAINHKPLYENFSMPGEEMIIHDEQE